MPYLITKSASQFFWQWKTITGSVLFLFCFAFVGIGTCGNDIPSQLIHQTVNGPVIDGVNLAVPGGLGNEDIAANGLVDITAAPFGADPTGRKDATRAIQQAIDFARDHQMVCFFPSGVYLVSDTLSCIQNFYQRSNGKVFGARHFPCVLLGSRRGKRPMIYLKPHSPGFGDRRRPKYVVHFWARSRQNPQEPAPAISMNQMFVNIDITIGQGNRGAIAIRHRGAQGSGIQESRLDVREGLTGIEGGCGSGGSHADITVIGGKIGLDLRQTQPAPTIVGITLIGQEETALLYQGRQALSAVGIKIVSAGPGPLVVGKQVTWTPFHGQICLVDSEIIFENRAGTALTTSSSLYLANVFFKNCSLAVSCSDGAKLTGNRYGWLHVKEFAHAISPKKWEGYSFAMPNYIDGIRSFSDIINIDGLGQRPPADLQMRHLWGRRYPSWESVGAVNVKKPPYNAKGDGISDDTAALQQAVNENEIIFLPKGYYNISQPLRLKARTKLVGVARHLSLIMARDGRGAFGNLDHPTPLLVTPNQKEARPLLSFCGLYAQNFAKGGYCLKWQSGKGMVRAVNFQTVPSVYGFGGKTPEKLSIKDFPLVLITGYGGGKWYNFFQEDMYAPTHGPRYRHLLIENTPGPLNFYQCDAEHSPGQSNIEINNARNVSIFGLKGEEKAPILLVKNSRNISVYGYGGNASAPAGKSLFLLDNSFDVRIIHAVDTPLLSSRRARPDQWHMIIEKTAGAIIKTKPLDRPLLYRRGAP